MPWWTPTTHGNTATQAHEENATITMVVRILGFGIIWAGFICFFM